MIGLGELFDDVEAELIGFRVEKGPEEPRPPSEDKLWVSQHYALFITDVLRVNLPPVLYVQELAALVAPSGRAGADPSPYPGRVFQGIYCRHRYRPLRTRVFSRRTALISCLSWGSALCRFQAARLAADLAAQTRLENEQAVDRLLIPSSTKGVKESFVWRLHYILSTYRVCNVPGCPHYLNSDA